MTQQQNKLRILVINYEYPPIGGGGGIICSQLCKHLSRLGHRIDVITMAYKELPREEIRDGVRIFRVPSIRSSIGVCRIHELASYILPAIIKGLLLARKQKYDLIHAHFIFPSGLPASIIANLTHTPAIITCHGSDIPGHNKARFIWAHKLLMPIWKHISSRYQLISPSNTLKTLILQNNPNANIEVINNGIDTNAFSPKPKKKSILCCSRINENKGIQYLIEAINQLDTDWQIDIAGDGPYLETLKEYAKSSKTKVSFHGWIPNDDARLKTLFEQASIFVLPSEFENFPTVLLEAMACGNAIVATDVGGIREVVGDAALFIRPKDTQGIKEALHALTMSPELLKSLQEKGLLRAKSFEWTQIAQKYSDLFLKQL